MRKFMGGIGIKPDNDKFVFTNFFINVLQKIKIKIYF